MQYRQLPQYPVPVQQGANTHSAWYRYLNDLNVGTPPSVEKEIMPTGSPFTFQAAQGGIVIISGGTVTQITYTRAATYMTGQTAGTFPVSAGDKITVTYSVTPAMAFAPT